jgi:hypothetical protein
MFLPLIMDTLEYRIGNGGRMRQKCSNDDIVEHDQGSSEECSYCAEYLNGVADGKAAGKREGIEAAVEHLELLKRAWPLVMKHEATRECLEWIRDAGKEIGDALLQTEVAESGGGITSTVDHLTEARAETGEEKR